VFITTPNSLSRCFAFSKHDDLLPTHAEELLGTGMQRALATTDVRINDVSASSARI
jgi:hypothetical protein